MATSIVFNNGPGPVFFEAGGRTILIQPPKGFYALQEFGVTDDKASPEDEKAGLFWENPETKERLRVVPASEYRYTQGLHRRIRYGKGSQNETISVQPQYCSLIRCVDPDRANDNSAELSEGELAMLKRPALWRRFEKQIEEAASVARARLGQINKAKAELDDRAAGIDAEVERRVKEALAAARSAEKASPKKASVQD